MERETGIEPASPAWKAGTLPLSYSRRCGAFAYHYTERGGYCLAGRCLRVTASRGVAVGSPEEAGSERDMRARALQIGHERLANFRIRGELPEVNAAHAPFRDVLDEEDPPAQPAARERGDEFFGAGRHGKRRRLNR